MHRERNGRKPLYFNHTENKIYILLSLEALNTAIALFNAEGNKKAGGSGETPICK